MTPQEAEDNIRRCGIEPTDKLVDQMMRAYYLGKADVKSPPKLGFMCRTDFDVELYYEQDAMVCATIDMLKRKKKCTDECGIIKVAIVDLGVVEPGSLCDRNKS